MKDVFCATAGWCWCAGAGAAPPHRAHTRGGSGDQSEAVLGTADQWEGELGPGGSVTSRARQHGHGASTAARGQHFSSGLQQQQRNSDLHQQVTDCCCGQAAGLPQLTILTLSALLCCWPGCYQHQTETGVIKVSPGDNRYLPCTALFSSSWSPCLLSSPAEAVTSRRATSRLSSADIISNLTVLTHQPWLNWLHWLPWLLLAIDY